VCCTRTELASLEPKEMDNRFEVCLQVTPPGQQQVPLRSTTTGRPGDPAEAGPHRCVAYRIHATYGSTHHRSYRKAYVYIYAGYCWYVACAAKITQLVALP
jgi:hypothetical protein